MPKFSFNNSSLSDTILIWDSKEVLPQGHFLNFLWQGFANTDAENIISIPEYIELNSKRLREKYLAWIYALGASSTNNKSVIKQLEIRKSFSYWWMTLLAEKCNFSKSEHINDALRLMALDELLKDESIGRILLVSDDDALARSIKAIYEKKGFRFEFRRLSSVKRLSHKEKMRKFSPFWLQGIIWFSVRSWICLWCFCDFRKKLNVVDSNITFITYLDSDNFLHKSADNIGGNYWGELPKKLNQQNIKVTWLCIYANELTFKSAKNIQRGFEGLNIVKGSSCSYVLIDSYLNLAVIFRTLVDWIRLCWIGRKVWFTMSQEGSDVELLHLFKREWMDSIYGPTSFSNLLQLNLFEQILMKLKVQKKGFFLKENQPWELALRHAWASRGHGLLMGVIHTAVRFWDLRYFLDARSYREADNLLPIEDLIVCNGEASITAYHESKYPINNLVNLGALRFSGIKNNIKRRNKLTESNGLTILILCDYVIESVNTQMKILEDALKLLEFKNISLIVKSHPNNPISLEGFQNLNLRDGLEPLPLLIENSDIVYSGPVTTAVLEAYYQDAHIITLLEPNKLNFSPLRGCSGIDYVTDHIGLAKSIYKFTSKNRSFAERNKNLFKINSSLNDWINLITK